MSEIIEIKDIPINTRAMHRKSLVIVAKILVSLTLVVYLLMRTDFRSIGSSMGMFNPFALLTAAAMYILSTILCAQRWRLFIPSQVTGGRLISLYFIGAFFNTCLPGVVGGDVVKIYYLNRDLKGNKAIEEENLPDIQGRGLDFFSSTSISIGSVIMDRFIGLVTLVAIVLVYYPWGVAYLKGSTAEWIVPIFLVAFILFSVIFFRFRITLKLSILVKLHVYMRSYVARKGVLIKAVLYSVVVQCITILSAFTISLGLSLHLPLSVFFVFIPLINIFLLLPISISGIGLREGAFVFFFGSVGVSMDKAIALSIFWFLSLVASSLIGLIQYIRIKKLG